MYCFSCRNGKWSGPTPPHIPHGQGTSMTLIADNPSNAQRAEMARVALDAFAAVAGMTVNPADGYGSLQVGELIGALLHYIVPNENPTTVLARALVDYDDRFRAEVGDP